MPSRRSGRWHVFYQPMIYPIACPPATSGTPAGRSSRRIVRPYTVRSPLCHTVSIPQPSGMRGAGGMGNSPSSRDSLRNRKTRRATPIELVQHRAQELRREYSPYVRHHGDVVMLVSARVDGAQPVLDRRVRTCLADAIRRFPSDRTDRIGLKPLRRFGRQAADQKCFAVRGHEGARVQRFVIPGQHFNTHV